MKVNIRQVFLITTMCSVLAGTAYSAESGEGFTHRGYHGPAPTSLSRKEAPEAERSSPVKAPKTGYSTTGIAYPTGRKDNSILWIEKIYPNVVKIGKPYTYTIKVTNLTTLDVPNVSITEQLPSGFNLQSSAPEASISGDKMQWALGKFSPKESRTISITGMTDGKAELPCCTAATYDPPSLCVSTSVVQPELQLAMTAASSVTACEKIPLSFTVSNPGDTAVSEVKILSQLPSGVMVAGKNSLKIDVGTLAAGASKTYTEWAQADRVGFYQFSANATASDELSATADASTTVIQPTLAISASTLREKQFVGRNITYNISVSNTGNATAESTSLSASLSGARSKAASQGGSVSGRGATWSIGDLEPGKTESVTLEATATDAGTAQIEAMAEAICSDSVTASATTEIVGISAILLEVVDVADPVEVGEQETYLITVTNQGSAPDTNIAIVATLGEGVEYVSSSGATDGAFSGQTVTFAPLARLNAQDAQEWRIVVRGTKEGDTRFKVSMNSDQLVTPVEETESTTIY